MTVEGVQRSQERREVPPVSESFDQLFGIPFSEFLRNKWQREFVFHQGDPNRLPELRALEADQLFAVLHAYNVANSGQISFSPLTVDLIESNAQGGARGNAYAPLQARERFRSAKDSVSVLFESLDKYSPIGTAYHQHLARSLGVEEKECRTYAVLSAPGKAFQIHFDHNDVINIQTKGRKRWVVEKRPYLVNPLWSHRLGIPLTKDQRLYWPPGLPNDPEYKPTPGQYHEFVMEPGSVCYIPRGHLHATESLTESQSVIISYLGRSVLDLLLSALSDILVKQPDFRMSLPGGRTEAGHPMRPRAVAALAPLLPALVEAAKQLRVEGLLHQGERRFQQPADFRDALRETFRPAPGVEMTVQFDFRDLERESFFVRVEKERLEVAVGRLESPTLRISAATEDMMLFARDYGEAVTLFQTGRVLVEPLDLMLVHQFLATFSMFPT